MKNLTRLREIVKVAMETLPAIRNVLSWPSNRVPPEALGSLEADLRLWERILTIGLYTLSNLPDDPAKKSQTITDALQACAELASMQRNATHPPGATDAVVTK